MKIEPCLSFEGRCEEAIEFYKTAVNAKVNMLMRFKDMPGTNPSCKPTPGTENKVMHADLTIGDSRVLVSDGRCTGKPSFTGISLALSVSDDAEAERRFGALAEGGKICLPLAKTFFSSRFGVVTDRFGVSWTVLVQH